MKKHLFLTGPSGASKSTIIEQALGDRLAYAGGFITRRNSSPEAKVLSYDLMPAAAACGMPGFQCWKFLDYSGAKAVKDNEVFRVHGTQLLSEAAYYPFVVLDEIGGFELLIPQFRKALEDLLNSDVPIIGVLKGADNAAQLRKSLGLTERYTMIADNLRKVLAQDEDTILLEVKKQGDTVAQNIARAWCQEYAGT